MHLLSESLIFQITHQTKKKGGKRQTSLPKKAASCKNQIPIQFLWEPDTGKMERNTESQEAGKQTRAHYSRLYFVLGWSSLSLPQQRTISFGINTSLAPILLTSTQRYPSSPLVPTHPPPLNTPFAAWLK